MYKILIVEDESTVRQSIVRLIDWAPLGFDEVFEAEHGFQALEIAHAVHPDLVLTDIIMPFMDGIELATRLKEELPAIRVAFLSGHNDFSYAQQAIGLGVIDYISKPFGKQTLTEKLRELREKLDSVRRDKQYIAKVRGLLHQSLPLLKEKALSDLVLSGKTVLNSAEDLASVGLSFPAEHYTVCLLESDTSCVPGKDALLYQFAVKNIVSEFLGESVPVFSDTNGLLVFLVGTGNNTTIPSNDSHYYIKGLLTELQIEIENNLEIPVTISIGSTVSAADSFYDSYYAAFTALESKYIFGTNAIYSSSGDLDRDSRLFYPLQLVNSFVQAIKAGNVSSARDVLNELLLKLRDAPSAISAKVIFIDLISNLLHILFDFQMEGTDIWHRGLALFSSIDRSDSVERIAALVQEYVLSVVQLRNEQISTARLSSTSQLVHDALSYIRDHYSDENLSLITTAEHLSVSPGYLSTLIKKETGVNFSDHLSKTRMQEAVRLLNETSMKTYEIAYATGFSNPHYFSVSFKKFTGKSPSEYRSESAPQ